jgi:hypothetical protein
MKANNKIAHFFILYIMTCLSCSTMHSKKNIQIDPNDNNAGEELSLANTVLNAYSTAQLAYFMENGKIGKVSEIIFVPPKDSKSIKYYEISQGQYCAELITQIDNCAIGTKLMVQVNDSATVRLKTNNYCINNKLPKYEIVKE